MPPLIPPLQGGFGPADGIALYLAARTSHDIQIYKINTP
jgi:hypothetical protein